MNTVSIQNLSHRYGKTLALDDVSRLGTWGQGTIQGEGCSAREDFKSRKRLFHPDRDCSSLHLNADQIRILELEIKYFKQRGIDLDEKIQEQIKEINKKISEISEKIQNNVTDEQSHFLINFPDNKSFLSQIGRAHV